MKSIGSKINFLILTIVVLIILFGNQSYSFSDNSLSLDKGDTSWMIVACAFVLLMTPGLAFFYGGMVNLKNIISTMLQSFVGLVAITPAAGFVTLGQSVFIGFINAIISN